MTMTLTKPLKTERNIYAYYLNAEFSLSGAAAGAASSVGTGIATGTAVGVATGSAWLGICAGASTVVFGAIAGGIRKN